MKVTDCQHGSGWAMSLVYSALPAERVPVAVELVCPDCGLACRFIRDEDE